MRMYLRVGPLACEGMIIVALFVLWPLVELAAAIAVAHAIGVLLTVLLLVAGWPVGTWLMRAEGRATLRRIRAALAAGRSPGVEAVDGALALAAGPLLIVPGFITDVLGLALLVPPVRRAAVALVARRGRRRFQRRGGGFGGGARRAYDVDSTARDLDSPQLPG
jgi:UPF0716 protein FxsA